MSPYFGRLISVIPVLAAFQFNIQNVSALSNLRDPSTEIAKDDHDRKRPVIYTFLAQTNGNLNDEHAVVANTWKDLWFDAGWEPKVLTMEDAMKHPKYERYSQEITKQENMHDRSFSYVTLMRWLAMSAQGTGGWMSDYDTMPMGLDSEDGLILPNAGGFTDYDGFVPSLLSGSAAEWERMSQNVMEMAVFRIKSNTDRDFYYSDMLAMQQLAERSPSTFIQQRHVFKGFPYKARNEVDCDAVQGVIATHVSPFRTHEAMEKGLVATPEGTEKIETVVHKVRHELARELYDNWKQQCSSSSSQNINFSPDRRSVHNGHISGWGEAFSFKRARDLSIVFMGDSLSRYQYLGLVNYLRNLEWIEPTRLVDNPIFTESFGGWTEAYLKTNEMLAPYENCDCWRNQGKFNWKYMDHITENRFYMDTENNNNIGYIQKFGKIDARWSWSPDQVHEDKYERNGVKIDESEVHHIGNGDWATAIREYISQIAPKYKVLVFSQGFWPNELLDEKVQQDIFDAIEESGMISVYKTLTKKQMENDAVVNELDRKLCAKAHICYDNSWTGKVPSHMYHDNLHFNEPVYRLLNSQLLELLEKTGVFDNV